MLKSTQHLQLGAEALPLQAVSVLQETPAGISQRSRLSLAYHQVAARTALSTCWAAFHTEGRNSALEFGDVSSPCLFLCTVRKIITRWHRFWTCARFTADVTVQELQLEWIWASVVFISRFVDFVTQRQQMHLLWLCHLKGAPGPSPQCRGSRSSWLKIKYPYN